jgi:hypothetical protein
MEGSFHFFVACLDGLALVVMLEPDRQSVKGCMLFARVQQDGLLEATSNLEAFHCGGQRIGTFMQPVLTPAEHVGILTDFDPVTVFGQMGTQGGGRLPVRRGQ